MPGLARPYLTKKCSLFLSFSNAYFHAENNEKTLLLIPSIYFYILVNILKFCTKLCLRRILLVFHSEYFDVAILSPYQPKSPPDKYR